MPTNDTRTVPQMHIAPIQHTHMAMWWCCRLGWKSNTYVVVSTLAKVDRLCCVFASALDTWYSGLLTQLHVRVKLAAVLKHSAAAPHRILPVLWPWFLSFLRLLLLLLLHAAGTTTTWTWEHLSFSVDTNRANFCQCTGRSTVWSCVTEQ